MKVLITGGAGFIGCNIADRLMREGHETVVFDNLSRPGASFNLEWLRRQGPVAFFKGDITRYADLVHVLRIHTDIDAVFHLAGQVAVTTSVSDPRADFNVNALGTFNVLEAVRESGRDAILIYASTNKVYGGMEHIRIVERHGRYAYQDYPDGLAEDTPLDFHSPYGCSKGAGDQYVRDYARIYGMRTVVFRQSCIYGPRQMGMEDQGWLAWFAIAALTGKPITIYGDGKQVRDILYIDDLSDACFAAIDRIDGVKGEVFNIGGGPAQAIAVWADFGPMLERLLDRRIPVRYGDWRPGDQRMYVSDIRKAQRMLGWSPRVDPEEGVARMVSWIRAHEALFV